MSKRNNFSRREFLKTSALLGATGLVANACSSFERTFSGDKRVLEDEVIILGGGVAGLSAAYTLKKNKIPYRVFEASARPGGRIYTLEGFTSEGQFAELGAEFFDESHVHVAQLCKELNIEVQEMKDAKTSFFVDGKVTTAEDYRRRMKPLLAQLAKHHTNVFAGVEVNLTQGNINKFDKALYYDNLSVADFLQTLRTDVDENLLKLYALQVQNRFGVEVESLSSLQLISFLNFDAVLNLQGPRSRYRVAQGMSLLTRSLYERAAGVIPDYFVKMESPLDSINPRENGFDLTFKTPSGKKSYQARQVICTLPLTALRDVGGIEKLDFSPLKKEWLQSQRYATESKGALEFNEAIWNKKIPLEMLGDWTSQQFADSGQGQNGKIGVLSTLRTGKGAADLDSQRMTEQALNDIEKLIPGARTSLKGNMTFMNWNQRPWQKGSRSYYAPGQFSRLSGVAQESEYRGRFLFAGEHTSIDSPGTVEGAIATGIAAAEAVRRSRL